MAKPVILMDAALDQVYATEGINNERVIQILGVRDSSHFIYFNAVNGTTVVPKSTLKKHLLNLVCHYIIRNYIRI